jgi:hypothetical protein
MTNQDASPGSTTVFLSGSLGGGTLSSYTWDHFVAPNLSKLTICGVPDMAPLAGRSKSWLAHFVMNATFRVRYEEPERQLIFAFLRRTQAAIDELSLGRGELDRWLQVGRDKNAVTQILTALRHFETSIAQLYQAFILVRAVSNRVAGNKDKLFIEGDQSPLDRLRILYNSSKHSEGDIAGGKQPPFVTTPIWITNEGLASVGAELSFAEIVALMEDAADAADYYSNPPADAIQR